MLPVPEQLNVLITGCSSGFGELAALTFADRGHRVFATMRTPGKSSALNARPDITQVALDVCDDASVRAALATVISAVGDTTGRIDVVVNNAGIELHGAVHLVSDEEVLRQFDTNVFGVVRVARAVVPHLLANGGGTIVNVGSIAGLVGPPYSGLYAASKHAVEALSEALHFELSQQGIRVRVVEPGQFSTALGANSVHAAAMTPDTPEYARFLRYRAAQASLKPAGSGSSPDGADGADGTPEAQAVAEAIYTAATEQPGRFRHLVGGDAELIAATKASMSFDDFDTTMRAALNWHD